MLDTFRRISNIQLKSRRGPGRWKARLGNSLAPALFRRAKCLAVGRIGMGTVGRGSAAIFGFDSRCQFFSPPISMRTSKRPALGSNWRTRLLGSTSFRLVFYAHLWTHLASVRLRASAQRFSRSSFASRTCGREAALVGVVAALSCTIGAAAQRLSDIHWCKMAGWTFVFESENICKTARRLLCRARHYCMIQRNRHSIISCFAFKFY